MTYVNQPAHLQERLDAIAAYVAQLRKEHKGDEAIGEICDQVELRCWGPIPVRAANGELKGFDL